MKLCQKYHVHILSVHDGYFDMDKAFDRLKLNIFISLAELESDNIGEQVKMESKKKRNKVNSSRPMHPLAITIIMGHSQ